MENKIENIKQIGQSIGSHVKREHAGNYPNKAIARARCTLIQNDGLENVETLWLVNGDTFKPGQDLHDITGATIGRGRGTQLVLKDDGNVVSKNTKLGEILTKYCSGSYSYKVPHKYRRKVFNDMVVSIHNRSTYKPLYGDPIEVEIKIAEESEPHRFQKLSHLINSLNAVQEEQIRKHKEELRKIEEDKARLARERAEAKEREEKERIAALEREKAEESRQAQEELARIEQEQSRLEQQVKSVRSFMRKNVMLRSQHLLDQYQEDAKRSHIYDNTPIVIDGGPGTGKTTTMIQRLKFLLSYQALEEYEAPLSQKQLEELTNEMERDNHWLFFSPTEMLLQYLRDNMREEGLMANDRNTRVVSKFRKKIMRDYQLFNPSKEGPFKDYAIGVNEEIMIKDAKKAIQEFEKFIIEYCNETFDRRIALKTSDYLWHEDAIRIKATCANRGKIKDIDALMRLFDSLQANEKANVKLWSDELKDQLKTAAMSLKRAINKDNESTAKIQALFEKWKKERLSAEEQDDEDAIIVDDEDENDEFTLTRQEFDTLLFSNLKTLIKQLGLKKHDSKTKISKRNQELLEIVKDFIDEDALDIDFIGSVALFVRNYASLCRGTESNILGIIPKLYKTFRKKQIEGSLYKTSLLKKLIAKDSNKHLHPDEQNLLIGFINEMLHSIYKKSRVRFENLKHKYANAFRESVRNVIGVDEATDYTLLDYYFMISFRHYAFSSVTLCGDIMQGLNGNGIKSWDELKEFTMPNLEVKSLNISYRQLPTLLDVARELYHDDLGVYPNYQSEMSRSDAEPKPLLYTCDDEEEKAEWISLRIREIWDSYGELPSIAIFVGDDVNIPLFIERINDLDLINGIDVVDCSGDRQLQNKEMVRVFRISEVKGMEFEAAFFYDIDEALAFQNEQLMRRYLYVGISRATSHLAATMKRHSNEDFVKYFETKDTTWSE